MSSNTTSPAPLSPEIVQAFTAIIHPSVNSLMIGHTFLTLLFPLLIALFYFSTPQSRLRPIFILNVIAIILAVTAGTMIDALVVHSILSIEDPWPPSVNIAIGIIGAFQSIFVDTVLLIRLMSVHPLRLVGPRRFFTLTALPILLKLARLTNLLIFIKVLVDASQGPLAAENLAIVWETKPYLKIEWTSQMVDNAYASFAFLWTIRPRGNRQGVTSDIHPNRVTFTQRMRMLFRIALSNFIFPTLFSIAQLVAVYSGVNVIIVNELVFVNSMLAVFGVVFATVWTGQVSRREAEGVGGWDGDDTSDEEKRPARKPFAFPGLGSWRVASASTNASAPETVTFGSDKFAMPSLPMESGGITVESRHNRGLVVIGGAGQVGTTVTTDSMDTKMGKEDVAI